MDLILYVVLFICIVLLAGAASLILKSLSGAFWTYGVGSRTFEGKYAQRAIDRGGDPIKDYIPGEPVLSAYMCPYCREFTHGATFCPHCGRKVQP